MRLKFFLLNIFLYISIPFYAQQISIKGCAIDEKKEIIPSATVRCLNNDSTLLKGCVTDEKGQFFLSVPSSKNTYILVVSFVGYKEYKVQIKGEKGTLELGNITLIPDTKQLGEVVVTGQQIQRTTEKMIYFPSKNQLKHASDGYNALATMMIPNLDVDPFTKKVSSLSGTTTLLINGHEASAAEVQNLNPKDILRIDFYDQHHPEYPDANSVIDFILVHYDHGGSVALDAQQHLNKGNGEFGGTAQFFKGKSEFTVHVGDGYNNYTPERGTETVLNLNFPEGTVVNNQKSLPSPQKSNNLSSFFNYNYQDKVNHLSTLFLMGHGKSDNEVKTRQTYSNEETLYDVSNTTHSKNLNPAFKINYTRDLPNKQSLRIGVRGSYNHNKYNRLYTTSESGIDTYSYLTDAKENHFNVVPSLNYSKNIGRDRFFVQALYMHTRSDIDYYIDGEYTKAEQTQGEGIIRIGYAWSWKNKLRTTVQWGDNITYLNINGNSSVKHYFYPSINLAYQPNAKNMIQVNGALGSGSPGVSMRSQTEQQIDRYQVLIGNEYLKTALFMGISMNYTLQLKRVDLTYRFGFQRVTDYPCLDVNYSTDRNLFVHTYYSRGTNDGILTGPRVRVKIIPQKLILDVAGYYSRNMQDAWNDLSTDCFVGIAKLQWMYKNLLASVQMETPKKSLEGGYFIRMPFTYNLNVAYSWNKWRVEFATRNPFSTVVEKTMYEKDGYSQSIREYGPRIKDDVFYVKVNYRFDWGKKHKFNQVQTESTSNSAIMKTK